MFKVSYFMEVLPIIASKVNVTFELTIAATIFALIVGVIVAIIGYYKVPALYQFNKHIPSLSFKEYEDRMVMLTAASKTFNLAGAQNSIVVIPDEKLREKWDKYTLGHRVIGGNAFGYIATQAAYEGGEEWLTGIKAQIYDNYLYLKKELSEKLPEVIVTPLEGTYLCWVDLKAYVSEENIKDMIQKKCRLAVDYGDWFGGERFGTHIRINLATSHENVKIAVDALVDNI